MIGCVTRTAVWALALLLAAVEPGRAPAGEPRPPTAALQGDQTLEDLAKRLYEDAGAADEIRAIHDWAPGHQPPPGETFRLPGPERRPAVSALGMAGQAVQQARQLGAAELAAEQLERAAASLGQARRACRRAAYQRCQQLADETWALARLARKQARRRRAERNRFAVSVDEAGQTRVEVMDGEGVAVTAGDQRRVVERGQAVAVPPGKPPEPVRALLAPPEPVLPFPGSRLVTTSIHFHWKPVEQAARYVLLISRDPAGRRPVRQLTTESTAYLLRSRLADGTYHWFLRSVDAHGHVGPASAARAFILAASDRGGMTVQGGQQTPADAGGAEP